MTKTQETGDSMEKEIVRICCLLSYSHDIDTNED